MNNVNTRIREFVVSVIFCAAAIYVVITAISTGFGFSGALKLAPVFALICLTATIVAQRYWVGLLLAVQASVWSPPVPVFDRLGGNLLVVLLIMAAFLPTVILKRNKVAGIHNHLSSFLMGGLLIIAAGWFVMDPPGSARMGTTGGLGEAFAILLGVIAYFFVPYIVAQKWDVKKNWQIYVFVVILCSSSQVLINVKRLFTSESLNVFTGSVWWLFPVILCPIFRRYAEKVTRAASVYFNLSIPVVMAASVLSAQRSRPFYALFMLLVIAHAYRLKTALVKRLLLLVIPAALLMLMFPQYIPSSAIRAMSIFLPAESAHKLQRLHDVQGEIGWTADWRKNMTELAWRNIRVHPFRGKGFAYSFDDIASAVWAPGGEFGAQTGLYEGLAVSGGYHNGLLTLAVFCGIPAALMFAVALVLTVKKFIAVLPNLNDVWLKYLSVSVLASFVIYTCHMLINGSGPQIFILCVMMGGMTGILWWIQKEDALCGAETVSAVNDKKRRGR